MLRGAGYFAMSAGLSSHINGAPFPPRTRAIVAKYPGPEEKSKRVKHWMIFWADHILYMQPSHAEALKAEVGAALGDKLQCLDSYVNLNRIPDPGFNMRMFDEVVKTLKVCTENFSRYIPKENAL